MAPIYESKLIEFLGKADETKLFFAYLSFTAPHWPLPAPDEDVARYEGRYDRVRGIVEAADNRFDNLGKPRSYIG